MGKAKMPQSSVSDALASFEGRAYVEACRWWIWCDAGFLDELKGQSTLDRHLVRRICNLYQVSRTIRVPQKPDPSGKTDKYGNVRLIPDRDDPNAQIVAEEVSTLAQSKSTGLVETSKMLEATITGLNAKIGTSPISASTKILWFLKPKGWTMFDRWAAKGVLGTHTNSIACMKKFFKELEERNFSDCLHRMRMALKHAPFGEQLAERVIDKYLFLVGLSLEQSRQAAKAGEELSGDVADVKAQEGFLRALPEDLRTSICDVARTLAQTASLESLRYRPKQKK